MHLRCETNDTDFTSKLATGDVMSVPVAHGDGNYFANDDILKILEDQNRIAFRYCDERRIANGAFQRAAERVGGWAAAVVRWVPTLRKSRDGASHRFRHSRSGRAPQILWEGKS